MRFRDILHRPVGLLLVLGLLALAPTLPAQPPPARPLPEQAPSLVAPLTDGQRLPLPELDPAVPSPAELLGHPLGLRFTRHHEIVAYLDALAAASPRVTTWRYGETYEGRPLMLVAVSSPANIARLDAIAAERPRLADPAGLQASERQRLLATAPAVVWLGYGVHGNESSSAEAAMAAAYVLAAAQGELAAALDRIVVLIDPLLNPDGRERYVHGYQTRRGEEADPDPAALEHSEPWPGGRGNHYAIDLNRDWSWLTQKETRHRVAAFRRWEPQVYVDYHEMGAESTYFFPPAAEPLHPRLAHRARRWLETFGGGNAAAFDRLGWTYYVGEVFDLFYPGYGDTYPTLRGGVGMTYEMAGGGGAGTVVRLPNGELLSLADRVARHLITSLATVATAGRHDRELLADFVGFRLERSLDPGPTFVWRADQPEADHLAELLRLHGIAVSRLEASRQVTAAPLAGGAARQVRLPAGAYAVTVSQPLGTLARVLLEREAEMPLEFLERQRQRVEAHRPAQFYDVTAWSLPLAFNLEGYVVSEPLAGTAAPAAPPRATGAVGSLVPPQGLAGFRFAAALQRRQIPFHLALEGLRLAAGELPAGTLFVPRRGRGEAFDAELLALAEQTGVTLVGASTSRTQSGIPLGSEQMLPIRPARIGLVGGGGVSPTSFGFVWHLLDREVDAEHTVLDLAALGQARLSRFDVLVFPDGTGYARELGDQGRERLDVWLREGGVLVAMGRALEWLTEVELAEITARPSPGQTQDGEGELAQRVFETQLEVPGTIVATTLTQHPLTVGLPSPPPVMFHGGTFYEPSGDPRRDLLRVADQDPVLAGFAWQEARDALAGSLLAATHPVGAGRVVLLTQDMAFRLFWRGTMPLLLNAVMYGPSLQDGGAGY